MYFSNIKLIVLSVVLLKWCDCHPSGAPSSACDDLLPHHGAEPQASKSPYVLRGRPKNDSIELIIESPDHLPFRGFAIQARLANASSGALGKFVVKGQKAHTIKCFEALDNTITHSDRSDKHELIIDWIPSEDHHNSEHLEIVFFGTVVQTAKKFWTNLSSEKLSMPSHTHEEHSHDHKGATGEESTSSSFQIFGNNLLFVSLVLLFFRKI